MYLQPFAQSRNPLARLFSRSGVMMQLFLVAALALAIANGKLGEAAPPPAVSFSLAPNPAFINCLAQFPGDNTRKPTANVTVTPGKLNDTLRIAVSNIKPGLDFDLFTVQNSNLLANGTVRAGFTNFGLAWYQSDLEVGSGGTGQATIQTILLNQIFGFDPAVSLPPTNTLHVGFWFNNPADATACGFSGTTPFNGEHTAGPLAMISLPNATTNLGPLCTKPSVNNSTAHCNP